MASRRETSTRRNLRSPFATAVVMVVALVVAGCGIVPAGELQPADGGAGATGTAGITGIVLTGTGGAGGQVVPPPWPNCGAKTKISRRLPPEILIVLDASGSMNDDITNMVCAGDGCGAASKWAQLVPALQQIVRDTQTENNWGLKFFASDNMCSVNAVAEVPVGPINAPLIGDAIASRTSANGGVANGSRTPTRAALGQAAAYLANVPDQNPKFILLATDGVANCPVAGDPAGDDAAEAAAAAARAYAAGFPVFVLGIATEGVVTGGVDASAALSRLAIAGGLPRAGTPAYFPVSSAAELSDSVRTLLSVSSSCTFQIAPVPTNDGTTGLGYIDVFADGTRISRDPSHMMGWDYTDASQQAIQFYGSFCDRIVDGTILSVEITFRCTGA